MSKTLLLFVAVGICHVAAQNSAEYYACVWDGCFSTDFWPPFEVCIVAYNNAIELCAGEQECIDDADRTSLVCVDPLNLMLDDCFEACEYNKDCLPFGGIRHETNENVCCPESCGTCGGPACGNMPGGADNCCMSSIVPANEECGDDGNQAPCVLESDPIYEERCVTVMVSTRTGDCWPELLSGHGDIHIKLGGSDEIYYHQYADNRPQTVGRTYFIEGIWVQGTNTLDVHVYEGDYAPVCGDHDYLGQATVEIGDFGTTFPTGIDDTIVSAEYGCCGGKTCGPL